MAQLNFCDLCLTPSRTKRKPLPVLNSGLKFHILTYYFETINVLTDVILDLLLPMVCDYDWLTGSERVQGNFSVLSDTS